MDVSLTLSAPGPLDPDPLHPRVGLVRSSSLRSLLVLDTFYLNSPLPRPGRPGTSGEPPHLFKDLQTSSFDRKGLDKVVLVTPVT